MEKILCITNDFGPRAGGIETFVIGLIERLPRGSVIVYTSAQDNSDEYDHTWLEKYGVEVIRDKARILLPTFGVAFCVKSLVRERSIETVFFGAAAPLALLSRGLRRAGVKKIVALTHGHEVWWSKVWPFSWAMRRMSHNIDHLTYLGEYTRQVISKSVTKNAAASMVKIAPGIDTDHFAPVDARKLRETLGLKEKRTIVSVGRLVHRKGQDTLIEAMPEICKQIPNAHLVIIGEGPYRSYLENRRKILGLEEKVTFIGRIQYGQLPAYICIGDLFVMPSRSRLAGLEVEGLGIVYLEASACGLPVIAGNSGGAPDAVLNGETGLVVDGTRIKEVASAVVELLSDPVRSQGMGERGREWIVQEWRWEIWASRFAQLLKVDR
ncbi:MAG: glycosyltransferase family 4 protein [Candidatus Planktophila sp.]